MMLFFSGKTLPVKRSQDRRRAGIERLEGRRLLTATVTQTYPGYYEVDAATSNTINIAVSQAKDTFTLEGVTYSNVAYIVVNGNGANDQIAVGSDNEQGTIGCAVNGGGGNDVISVSGLSAVIHGGSGNDQIVLKDSFYGEVYGDSGADQIYVVGDCYDAEIVGGTGGGNMIDAWDSNYGVTILGESGNDTIYGSQYDDAIYGYGGSNDVMYGNGGNDTFYASGGMVIGSGNNNTAYVPTGANVTVVNIQNIFYS